jgi:hypothetical protein
MENSMLLPLTEFVTEHHGHRGVCTGRLFGYGPIVTICVQCQRIAIHPKRCQTDEGCKCAS